MKSEMEEMSSHCQFLIHYLKGITCCGGQLIVVHKYEINQVGLKQILFRIFEFESINIFDRIDIL